MSLTWVETDALSTTESVSGRRAGGEREALLHGISASKLCLLCKGSTPCNCIDCVARREANTQSILAAIHKLNSGMVLSDKVVTDAVRTLADAAQSGGFDGAVGKLLGSSNCLRALVAVIRAGATPDKASSSAAGLAAATLAVVARSGWDAQNACFAECAITPLVGLLHGGDDSAEAASAARAICAICSGLPQAQEELIKSGSIVPLITMLSVRRSEAGDGACEEAARALACLAPPRGGAAVKHWIRWCQGRGLAPLRGAIDTSPHDANAFSFKPDGTRGTTTKGEEAALTHARERWLLVRFGTWLLQDARQGPEDVHDSLVAVQAWHNRLFGVYLTESVTEADAGKRRAPPPPPPLPPPLSLGPGGAPRKPRKGIEPRVLWEGMQLLLGDNLQSAPYVTADVANKRACVAASLVGMLRGSEAALREEVAWDPAIHLTRADLFFEADGTDAARAVITTRCNLRVPRLQPYVCRLQPYVSRHLDLSVRNQADGEGRLWLVQPPAEFDGAPQTIVPMPRFLRHPEAPGPSHRYLTPLSAPAAAPPDPAAAKAAAVKAAVAAIKLFQEWDTDGDGQVTRAEFGKAMQAAGLDAPDEEIDALFDAFDPERTGTFSYKAEPGATRTKPNANAHHDPTSKFARTPVYYDEGEKSVPVYIPKGGTMLDAYRELKRLVEADPVAPEHAPHTPLFRDPRTGGPISVQQHVESAALVPQLRDLVRALLYAAGTYQASDYGAHSLRVGGASALYSIGAEPIAIRALARCADDVYALYLEGHAAEARWLALRSVSVDFGAALFRHFDQVAHE